MLVSGRDFGGQEWTRSRGGGVSSPAAKGPRLIPSPGIFLLQDSGP